MQAFGSFGSCCHLQKPYLKTNKQTKSHPLKKKTVFRCPGLLPHSEIYAEETQGADVAGHGDAHL